MGHNSMVSSHPKSTGIPWVDRFSTGPPDLGCHKGFDEELGKLRATTRHHLLGMKINGYNVAIKSSHHHSMSKQRQEIMIVKKRWEIVTVTMGIYKYLHVNIFSYICTSLKLITLYKSRIKTIQLIL